MSLSHYYRVELDVKYLDMQVQLVLHEEEDEEKEEGECGCDLGS